MSKPTRRQIARAARVAVEEVAKDWQWPESNLMGLCGIASFALTFLFQRFGYKSVLIQGKYNEGCHCWVDAGKTIWDITATQFGKNRPKVLVMPKAKADGYKPDLPIVTESDLEYAFKGWYDQAPEPGNTKPIIEKALSKLLLK